MDPKSLLVVALALVTSGCLGPTPLEFNPAELPLEFPLVEVQIPVHVVLVGVEPDLLDPPQLRSRLPTERIPIIESVTNTTGTPTLQRVRYTFTYEFHDAPTAFTDGFLRYALANGQLGRPNAWLVDYDAKGPKRLCSNCPTPALDRAKDILYLDALKSEAWIQENRAQHGLEFEADAVTFFLLDGENAGVFPTNTYHYWRFDDGMGHSKVPQTQTPPTVPPPIEALGPIETPPFHTPKDPISMRAWGGRWNFVWLDLTAAPSAYDYTPRRPYETATDPPLWEARANLARLHENLGRDLADFLHIRVARDPIYPVTTYNRFVSPIHVFVETGAMENPRTGLGVDLAKWVPRSDIEESIRLAMPWVEVSTPVTFYFLPQDDPGMDETLRSAKRYGDPSLVSAGIVKSYVRQQWSRYVAEAQPGEFVIPQFYFYFNGFYTFWGVSTAGGWADGDAWGRPWAIFDHFFDFCVRATTVPCSKATIGFTNITILPVHEAGHEIGLTHTKDAVEFDNAQWNRHVINWLWDSTYSTMSYRHTYMRFDHFDQRFLAIAHATAYLERAHEQIRKVSDRAQAYAAYETGLHARSLLDGGDWVEAVRKAEHAEFLARDNRLPEHPAAAPYHAEIPVLDQRLIVPASRTGVGSPTLGLTVLNNPSNLDATGASYASTNFEVPADATYVHIKYRDANPLYLGTFKDSAVVVLGPDKSFRGSLTEDFEDEVYLTSHWRGAGVHELRVYQLSGTPGAYQVQVTLGRT